nr:MAG: replication associated protein [Arizlama virus]
MPTVRGTFWMWTLNNPTEEEKAAMQTIQSTCPEMKFLLYQLEEGEQHTPHLQGYLELKSRKTLRQTQSLFGLGQRIHLDLRRGTQQQAVDYVTKEDGRLQGPWEFGTRSSGGGERSDLATIQKLIRDDGWTDRRIADEFFSQWCHYGNAFRRYRSICIPARAHKTEVTVIVGPPGTGKSRYAMDNYPSAYWKQRSIWWDNYDGEHDVVIDDFYGWLPYDSLLRLCDRYPLLCEVKGGQVNFVAKRICITSNHTPAQWYKNVGNIDAFIRRVTSWMYLGTGGVSCVTNEYSEFCNAVDRRFNTEV